jgi:uncharacterized membrane protein
MNEEAAPLDPAERGISVTLGIALLAFAAARGRSARSLVLGAAGAYLAHRGATGRCAVSEQLDALCALEDDRLRPGRHAGASIEAAVTVQRPVAEAYAFWRALENAPRFMTGIESVEGRGGNRTLWVARGPMGDRWRWEAEVIEDHPNELLVWRSRPGSDVHHEGAVRFAPGPAPGTAEVRVAIALRAPGGAVGRALARLARRLPEMKVEEDLRRFRQLIEAGEVPVAGRPRGPEDGGEGEEDEDDLDDEATGAAE